MEELNMPLEEGKMAWGMLKSVEKTIDQLLKINISDKYIYVDASIEKVLESFKGKSIRIAHLSSRWGVGKSTSI